MSIEFIGGGLGQIGTLKQHNLSSSGKASEAKGTEFSVAMTGLQSAEESMQASSSERSEKIASLKAQIQEGSYQVESSAVAEKLLADVFSAGVSLLEEQSAA